MIEATPKEEVTIDKAIVKSNMFILVTLRTLWWDRVNLTVFEMPWRCPLKYQVGSFPGSFRNISNTKDRV